jgi:hypothetical protein
MVRATKSDWRLGKNAHENGTWVREAAAAHAAKVAERKSNQINAA